MKLPPFKLLSKTCEVRSGGGGEFCGKPTVSGYPANGGSWQSLCEEHAAKHQEYTIGIILLKELEKP